MRRLVSVAMGMALALTVLVVVPAAADPAIVARDAGPCAMPASDADGDILFDGDNSEATHIVANDNVVVLTCKGSEVTNESGRGQHFSGFPCMVVLGGEEWTTDDTHATVAKNGQGTMTCKVDLGDVPV